MPIPIVAAIEEAALGPFGFAVSFLAGLVSFASPCVLPLAPGYISYVSGLTGQGLERPTPEQRRRLLAGIGLFVLGLATVFTVVFGIPTSLLGGFILDHMRVFNYVAGAFVVLMGLSFLGLLKLRMIAQERRLVSLSRVERGLGGAFPLGFAFGLGWSPCVGPVLGVVLTFALQEGNSLRGALLLFFYALGLGVPFLVLGLALHRLGTAFAWLQRHALVVERVSGAVMVGIGILLITNIWNDVIAPLRRLVNSWAPPI